MNLSSVLRAYYMPVIPTNTLRIKPKWMFSPLKPVASIRIMHTKKVRQQT